MVQILLKYRRGFEFKSHLAKYSDELVSLFV